jgi:hypothetical protein
MSALPPKADNGGATGMSALCQNQTKCVAAKSELFDHLVGAVNAAHCGLRRRTCLALSRDQDLKRAKND